MLPKLRETTTKYNTIPHLVIVSSEVHFVATFSERNHPQMLDALADKEKSNMTDRSAKTTTPSKPPEEC